MVSTRTSRGNVFVVVGKTALAGVPLPVQACSQPSRAKPSGKQRRRSSVAAQCSADDQFEHDSRSLSTKPESAQEIVAERKVVAAAVRLQSWFRGIIGRIVANRQRIQIEQRRLEEKHERSIREKRAAAELERQAAEERRRSAEILKQDEKLRTYRERRCAIEEMITQMENSSTWKPVASWEENSAELLEMLARVPAPDYTSWFGSHPDRRSARKRYLVLARRWHPDKWASQGGCYVVAATAVMRAFAHAYEKAMRELPQDGGRACCEDDDEDVEVWEFASWVGVSFEGMFEVWKERKGVTAGR